MSEAPWLLLPHTAVECARCQNQLYDRGRPSDGSRPSSAKPPPAATTARRRRRSSLCRQHLPRAPLEHKQPWTAARRRARRSAWLAAASSGARPAPARRRLGRGPVSKCSPRVAFGRTPSLARPAARADSRRAATRAPPTCAPSASRRIRRPARRPRHCLPRWPSRLATRRLMRRLRRWPPPRRPRLASPPAPRPPQGPP